jgi:hypothetical protein
MNRTSITRKLSALSGLTAVLFAFPVEIAERW